MSATPYREATNAAPALAIACASCGAFAKLGLREAMFRCPACGLHQTTEPEVRPSGLVLHENKAQRGYDELSAFASSLGVGEGGASIAVKADGIVIETSLDIDSGRVRGLELTAYTTGLPAVVLRREKEEDVAAKQQGVSRELQTGDPTFDDAVYVESDAADVDVMAMLGSPHVRAAIVELLRWYETIEITSDHVAASRNFNVPVTFGVDRIERQIALLRRVAGAARPLVAQPARGGGWPLAVFGVFNPAACWVAFGFIMHAYAPLDRTPIFVGIAVGLALALALQPLLRRSLSGRSTSHRDILLARILSVMALPALPALVFVLLNARLDDGTARTHRTPVKSVEFDSDDRVTHARIEPDGLPSHVVEFGDSKQRVQPGQPLVLRTKPGAFGYAWQIEPATVTTSDGTIAE